MRSISKFLYKFLTIVAFFAVTSLSTQAAFATGPTGTPKPGWGHGDKNHEHTGPPGLSVRSNDHISISNTITIIAEGSAKVVVNVVNNIFHIIHGHA